MQRSLAPLPTAASSGKAPDQVLIPEVMDSRLTDVEAVARWMDYAFELPGGFRFGVAGIIGLIPGIGDIFDALVSVYIVVRAVQLGVARVAIARMLLNIGIEALAGAVPFAGDMFDVVFKANRRNFVILKNHMAEPRRQRAKDWLFVLGALALATVAIALPAFALVKLLNHQW